MDASHKALSRVRDGAVERMGFWHGEPGWWSWLWGYSFGASIFDESTGRATIDAPQSLAAYRWLQSYVRSPGLSSDQANAAAIKKFEDSYGFYNTAQNAFLSGKVAMVLQGPWLANMIKQFVPDMDYSVVPMPVAASVRDDASPIALVDTDVLCIPRGCKHPREAMEFIAFTQRPEITERLATAHCKVCPLKTCSAGFVSSHPNRGLSVHNALADSPRAFVVPKTRAWPQIKDEFDAMVLRLRALKGDADTELATMQSRAQEMIDRVNQQRKLRYGDGAASLERGRRDGDSIASAIRPSTHARGGAL
jgi:ABC-type glycerol-3-phosphate transport system substrate-binding protein